ncbi:MAG: DNA repair exonuclease [Methanobrevibacter sp.]|nr:DNA repair exonuclease [Methanobrevibacter sp.]
MRFAHLADTHLGYRQYNLIEREEDFYETFHKTVDKIIESEVDFVIHSGDLFESNKPSTRTLFEFQKGFFKLKEAGIPIYAIAGNHDSVMSQGSLPPQVLFKDLGLKLISPNQKCYLHGGVLICGLPFSPKTKMKFYREELKKLEKEADRHLKSILVMHQGIDKYFNQSYELELEHIPRNFDYYALGHLHNYIVDDFGKGKLVYPGSGDVWRTNELEDARKNGKGFCIVNLSQDPPEIERVKIDVSREYFREYIDYDKLDEKLEVIKNRIINLEKKPVLELIVENGDFNSSDVYDIINDALGEHVLTIRPTLRPDTIDGPLIPDDIEGTLDPRGLLYHELDERHNSKEINNLAVDLLDNLSKGNEEESKHISDKFYEDFYGLKINSSDDIEIAESENSGDSDGNMNSNNRDSNGNSDSNNRESSKNTDLKSMDNPADDEKGKSKIVSLDNF